LPLFILYNLLSAWLKSEGVDLKAIGLFALVGIPYTWKFIWAPAMDRFTLPILGRRRGWMIATQVLVMFAVMLMGQFNPSQEIWVVVGLAAVVAFFSASQDGRCSPARMAG
jgi:PAT family beta-lactamase induction signal transducer AmpG